MSAVAELGTRAKPGRKVPTTPMGRLDAIVERYVHEGMPRKGDFVAPILRGNRKAVIARLTAITELKGEEFAAAATGFATWLLREADRAQFEASQVKEAQH